MSAQIDFGFFIKFGKGLRLFVSITFILLQIFQGIQPPVAHADLLEDPLQKDYLPVISLEDNPEDAGNAGAKENPESPEELGPVESNEPVLTQSESVRQEETAADPFDSEDTPVVANASNADVATSTEVTAVDAAENNVAESNVIVDLNGGTNNPDEGSNNTIPDGDDPLATHTGDAQWDGGNDDASRNDLADNSGGDNSRDGGTNDDILNGNNGNDQLISGDSAGQEDNGNGATSGSGDLVDGNNDNFLTGGNDDDVTVDNPSNDPSATDTGDDQSDGRSGQLTGNDGNDSADDQGSERNGDSDGQWIDRNGSDSSVGGRDDDNNNALTERDGEDPRQTNGNSLLQSPPAPQPAPPSADATRPTEPLYAVQGYSRDWIVYESDSTRITFKITGQEQEVEYGGNFEVFEYWSLVPSEGANLWQRTNLTGYRTSIKTSGVSGSAHYETDESQFTVGLDSERLDSESYHLDQRAQEGTTTISQTTKYEYWPDGTLKQENKICI